MFRKAATRRVLVSRPVGLHARPCLAIATAVRRFQSKVTLRTDRGSADGGEVLQLLSLGAAQGTEILLSASGPDAEQVLDELVDLFDTDFGLHDEPDRHRSRS